MLECVQDAVVAALRDGGLTAARAYEPLPLDRQRDAAVYVGIRGARWEGSGFGEYLGWRTDPETGAEQECYALRCQVEVSLDIYASQGGENGAAACTACFDRAVAALRSLPAGLKLKALSCGGAAPDGDSGRFRCQGVLEGVAYLLAQPQEESGEFTDFILKGVLKG